MEYTEFIKENLSNNIKGARSTTSKVHIAPDISEKVLTNAVKSTKELIEKEYYLGIIDTSLTGSGKEGIYLSGEKIVIKELMEQPHEIYFKDIEGITTQNRVKKEKNYDYNVIKLKNGSSYSISEMLSNYINANLFEEFIDQIIELNEENDFIETNQIIPLEDLDEEIKTIYVKILCNYAYSNDNIIDSSEYADIVSFIARINMDSEHRVELRSYMSDVNMVEDTFELVEQLSERCGNIDFGIIKMSLLKDLIALYAIEHGEEELIHDKFILTMADELDINSNELHLFLDTHKYNQSILEKRLNDSDIKKTIKDISSKAASVGVPMAALYLSGTAGVSAIGMTSGLATLGMGGLLGFSSMFTGVGVLALLGITSYQGMKKLTGLNDEKNNKHRELMLQEIIKNNQKSLQYLIEDVNTISSKLINEIKSGEQNSKKIEKLGNILRSISKGSEEVANRVDHYESENVLTKAPQIIKKDKLYELSSNEDQMIYRDKIMQCYSEEDGVLKLKYNISRNDADELLGSLSQLGYFNLTDNASATVKSTAKNLFSNIRR
ncbi:hypothetical protein BU072_00730 [Mammaliicoccus vitulinus]|uniref:ENT domain-containing protein n=1 Tax=Mammaliicoccus vitulinus TaxID=71237 RepID=A0A2T4PXC2_9STAP|nr:MULTISPECIES: hypothetical protein [Mammaliicoccus]MBF0794368.1 hypothetical protein [Mammaliicoccus lentus]PTI31155.1 hypothetical protein BU072_00730 [Mammaliicoccus vitulinus]QMU09737.1 hypothetical protein H3V22_08890 [Mammaliicoccus lentus]TFV16244.1 hypothetical protein E4T78_06865 [Mammaliicoccus lentus]WGZ42395.1 hypothetical protein PN942_08925 [Mammaliicoccus lentus]